jgi:hypothetical protein
VQGWLKIEVQSCKSKYRVVQELRNTILEYGHISQRVRRSTLHPPASRHSRKTSFLNPRDCLKFITSQRPSRDVSRYEGKALGRSKSAMGKAKTYRRQRSSAKERRTHASGTKETFPTNESSVGGKKKSSRQKITYDPRPMRFTGQRLAASVIVRVWRALRQFCALFSCQAVLIRCSLPR